MIISGLFRSEESEERIFTEARGKRRFFTTEDTERKHRKRKVKKEKKPNPQITQIFAEKRKRLYPRNDTKGHEK